MAEYAVHYGDGLVSDVEMFPELFSAEETEAILAAKRKTLDAGPDDAVTMYAVVFLEDPESQTTDAFNPDEPRDKVGKWTSFGSGGGELLHGTTTDNLKSILKSGIRVDGKHRVWTTNSFKIAADYASLSTLAKKAPIILEVRVPKDHAHDFTNDPGFSKTAGSKAFFGTKTIPAQWIVGYYKVNLKSGKHGKFISVKDAGPVDEPRDEHGRWVGPRTFYRGTNPGDARRIKTGEAGWDSHLFASSDRDLATAYGSNIETLQANPDAKILYEGTQDWVRVVGRWRKDENLLAYAARAAEAAKKAGYDAAWFKQQGNVGTAIFNPDKFTRHNMGDAGPPDEPRDERGRWTEGMKDFLRMSAGASGQVSLAKFLLEHGRSYEMTPETYSCPRGEPHLCFMNAAQMAMGHPDQQYVEGYVDVHGVPIKHAWVVNKLGQVSDPTLKSGEGIGGYFGVPFGPKYLSSTLLKNKVYGLLGTKSHKTILPLLEGKAKFEDYDPNEPRDPLGKWTASGGDLPPEEEESNEWLGGKTESGDLIAYHGTVDKFLAGIEKDGIVLKPGTRNFDEDFYEGDRRQSVFVSSSFEWALDYAELAEKKNSGHPVIVEVHIPASEASKLKSDDMSLRYMEAPTEFALPEAIPPEWIKAVHTKGAGAGWTRQQLRDAEPDHVLYLVVLVDGEPVHDAVLDFDPDQPRDAHGRWTFRSSDSVSGNYHVLRLQRTGSRTVRGKNAGNIEGVVHHLGQAQSDEGPGYATGNSLAVYEITAPDQSPGEYESSRGGATAATSGKIGIARQPWTEQPDRATVAYSFGQGADFAEKFVREIPLEEVTKELSKITPESRGSFDYASTEQGVEAVRNALLKKRLSDFNPDEPRDDHGRWTTGMLAKVGGKAEWIRQKIDTIAEQLGYPKEKIFMSDATHTFDVNGKHYTSGGVAFTRAGGMIGEYPEHYEKGDIVIFGRPGFDQDFPVRGIVAHEIEHQKFQTVFDQYIKEDGEIIAEQQALLDKGLKGKAYREASPADENDVVKPESVSRYPTLAALQPFLGLDKLPNKEDGPTKLAQEDGVSNYSKQYWDEFAAGGGRQRLAAIHETLGEMSRLREEHELGPKDDMLKETDGPTTYVAPIWMGLFHAVDEQYKRIRMLQRTTIDGQGATVAFLRGDMEPTDEAEATFIKVTFDDGRVVFAKPEVKVADAFDPNEPRDERGRWTLSGNLGDPASISSRIVTAKGRGAEAAAHFEEVRTHYARADLEGMRLDTANFANNVNLFSYGDAYPQFRAGELDGKTTDQQVEIIVSRMTDNLEALWDSTSEAERELWKTWYEGAHNFVSGLMKDYGFDRPSTTAVVAALSPNKEWDPNAYLARQVISIYRNQQFTPWSKEMTDKAYGTDGKPGIWWKEKDQAILARMKDENGHFKMLAELTDPVEKAVWIRTYDEANSNRQYHLVNIDGTMGALATNKDKAKTPSRAAWQTLSAVSAAVAALEYHGDVKVLSEELSDNHKVRSFYNNILDPNSRNLDVTIDTHAAGAALMAPYGGNTTQIQQLFGTSPDKDKQGPEWKPTHWSKTVGAKGLYPIYTEAYRRVAERHGIQPRQLQSILWERKIQLFGEASPVKKAAILAVWQRYHDGAISLREAQQGVIAVASAPPEPKPPKPKKAKKAET